MDLYRVKPDPKSKDIPLATSLGFSQELEETTRDRGS
jgi:hypothetical protein